MVSSHHWSPSNNKVMATYRLPIDSRQLTAICEWSSRTVAVGRWSRRSLTANLMQTPLQPAFRSDPDYRDQRCSHPSLIVLVARHTEYGSMVMVVVVVVVVVEVIRANVRGFSVRSQ